MTETIKIDENIKNIIPVLSDTEYKQLEENILENGCLNPLTIWKSKNILLDGHNRLSICSKHNIKYETINLEFLNDTDAEVWIINNQLGRRNLSDFSKVELQLKKKDLLLQKGKETQGKRTDILSLNDKKLNSQEKTLSPNDKVSGQEKIRKPDSFGLSPNDKKSNDKTKHNTRKELAKEINISTGKFAEAEIIIKNADQETKDKLRKGELTIGEVYKEIRREKRNTEKNDRIKNIKPVEGKYRIIYADPPWQYNDKQDIENLGGANKHYNTLSITELCELQVGKNKTINDISEDNSILFLWVTSPLLEDSFKIIKAWGFKYKTSFVWDKVKHNMGHYNSVRHEFLLIATKGISMTPENIKLYDSVQSVEKTNKHSEKPEVFRKIIDTLYPSGNRIELFSRKKIKNWEVWGNEI